MELSAEALEVITDAELAALSARDAWLETARAKQVPPEGDWDTLLWLAGRFFGKALATTEIVPTPRGWTTMGELRAGDEVFDETGHICRVTRAWSVLLDRPCYELEFNDDTKIVSDAEHEWLTWDKIARKAKGRSARPTVHQAIRTTAEIISTLRVTSKNEANHSIVVAGALELPTVTVPVAPYVLGYWLGNGTLGSPEVTSHSNDAEEIEEYFKQEGYALRTKTEDKRDSSATRLSFGFYSGPTLAPVGTLRHDLRAAGVFDHKHIPKIYLRASKEQRAALLQGLMDSDGYPGAGNSVCEFCSIDKDLADSVHELALSLGIDATIYLGRATLNGKDCGPKYRVCFYAMFPVFRCERKLSKQKPPMRWTKIMGMRHIVGARQVPSVPVRCIAVDSPSKLFLVSRSMIPTHNSRTLTETAWWECFRVPGIIGHALAPTIGDVRRITMEGESGFLNKVPRELIKSYNRTPQPELTFHNGSKILGFGVVDEADRLRGPQCHFMTFDECAAADRPAGNLESAYKVAALGCRLPYPDGTPSRKFLATTPRPIPFLKQLIKRPGVKVIHGTSYENLKNVASSIKSELLAMEGTQFGKQELYAQILDSNDHAIFQRNWIRLWPPFKKLPEFTHILMSMDTAFEEEHSDEVKKGKEPDYSACAILGIFNTAQCFTEAERKAMRIKTKYAALLCDFWMERMAFPDLLEAARKAYRTKWGQPGRRPDTVLIENKASGISLRQTLMQYGVPTLPFNPRGQSKTMRAHTASPLVMQGMLFMPESSREDRKGQVRDWAEPLMDQLTQFAGEGTIEFDDGLDCCTQAMIHLMEKGYFHAEPMGRAFPDMDEKEDREHIAAIEASKREKRGQNPYDI